MSRRRLLAAVLAALAVAVPAAHAHDSWLARAPGEADARLLRLELGTGPRFPLRDARPSASGVALAACRTGDGAAPSPLTARQEHATHLELRARVDAAAGFACWAELKPQAVELSPDLVDAYFTEVRPPEQVRGHWKSQQARGVGWHERYRKFTRIEWPAPSDAAVPAVLREPQGLAMEIVPVGNDVIRAGRPAAYRLLWDGRPLADHWVEFVSERHALGVWRRTDAQGQVELAAPYPGRWLLRAVRLEPPGHDAQPWRSRFATLLVHVR